MKVTRVRLEICLHWTKAKATSLVQFMNVNNYSDQEKENLLKMGTEVILQLTPFVLSRSFLFCVNGPFQHGFVFFLVFVILL